MTVLQHQFWHLLSLLTLLVGILLLVNKDDSLLLGELGGVSSATWMILAILSPYAGDWNCIISALQKPLVPKDSNSIK